MRSRARELLPAAAAASLGAFLIGWLALTDWEYNDYAREARPAFDALLGGHVLRFLQLAPAYGGSLVLRAPFVLIPKLWGGGALATYRAAAAPALMASVALAVWLIARMRARDQTTAAMAAALIVCVANPMTVSALQAGHPEELLGAVLCVAAVLAALADRPVWAGVLLGLAIANKEWALVAAGPVLIALPGRRVRACLAAAAAAAAVLVPLAAAGGVGGGGFVTQIKGATQTGSIFTPWQLWWFVGPRGQVITAGHRWGIHLEPAWLQGLAHPLIVAIVVPLTLLCLGLRHRGSPRPRHEALLLLMLVLLLRCMLDPWDNTYYPLPFLLALLAWEVLSFDRAPVLALVGSGAAWFVFQWAVHARGFQPDTEAVIFLTVSVPALLAVVTALYAPGLPERLAMTRRRRPAVATPA